MLHAFVTANRNELIQTCKSNVDKRREPAEMSEAPDHGVPIFLEQLVDTLRLEQTASRPDKIESDLTLASTAIGRAAALNGAELLRQGYTIDQVVHGYGDICQTITSLAVKQKYEISSDEFRTLNRCLDDAIADAVSSFGRGRQVSFDAQANISQEKVIFFANEQRRLAGIASQAFFAIKTGNVGMNGATGTLLSYTLDELVTLAARTWPDIGFPVSALEG